MTDTHIISRNQQPLTLDQIAQSAPSALALQPASDRSSRYSYIPTLDVIRGMEKAGFLPFSAIQSNSRTESHRNFTKHMIRFRQVGSLVPTVGDTLPEVVLVNAHDGTSKYKLMLGIFRFICANGMVVADSMFESLSIRHTGNVIDAVIEGSTHVIEAAPKVLTAVKQWSNLLLTDGEQLAFASAAHTLRFADADGKIDTPITPEQLLRVRRADDEGNDLYRTFNRVQEAVIRGGDRGFKKDESGKRRRVTTREVKSISGNISLNRALWQLAEEMAKLKAN